MLAPLLRGGLVDHEGRPVASQLPSWRETTDDAQPMLVGVYFTASWCPPCQAFSPTLRAFAQTHAAAFQVVLVSLDTDPDAAAEYIVGKTGWLAVPWADRARRQSLTKQLGVSMIPQLTILNGGTGAVVSTWGRSAILKNPQHCLEEWQAGGSGVSWWQLLRPW
ncbi:thioredoxin-like protein [Syncephalis pseudoplumigaleata]|uniref:Thioredoxin-like protein n=1 Tax=Syncephalis pseudoplumigaleata TaxID=1712513 RepID=A0A4P9Z3L3_9FUNG|nr:thioredoxin-like protein [Syncephalis pseudoplumigaleata]|eukprot:RKP27147.1 thioredoxin-like protein [Syncephalis pseudoplumigaleata]